MHCSQELSRDGGAEPPRAAGAWVFKKSNFADQLKLLQNNADTLESEGGDGGTGSTNEYNDIFGDPNLFKNFGGFDN